MVGNTNQAEDASWIIDSADVTYDSGPRMIADRLSKEAKERYLSQPGYRYRIVK